MALTSLFPSQGLQSFIDESLVQLTATNGTPGATQFRSSVVNRAPITDISQNLKVSMGIERVMVQQLIQLQNEFGPNGEPIWSALNDDRGMMRFIGNWQSGVGAAGAILVSAIGNSCEVTFYGTALNILTVQNGSAESLTVSVDGGTGTVLSFSGISTVIGTRNYAANQVVTLASALTLGVHTVKVTWATTTNWNYSGFEVINESTTIKTNPGSAFVAGKRLFLSAQDSQSPTSGFTNTLGSAGIKGGHVLQYLASDGTVKKDIQYVDTSALFMTAADHTNEEVVRTYHWREFGAGRTDDFSIIPQGTTGTYAFTLDDGTTTLVGSNVGYGNGTTTDLRINNNGGANYFIALTFVGTGLDIMVYGDTAGTTTNHTLSVDGVSQGAFAPTFAVGLAAGMKKLSLCSGLPYGTHTVKINATATTPVPLNIRQFVVYQPKKPSLPAGAVELADYNVIGNYVGSSIVGSDVNAAGILRKVGSRELVYSGTWAGPSIDAGFGSGFNIQTTTVGSYLEYTFFGTGFEFKTFLPTAAYNVTVSVDGSSNLSAFTTGVTTASAVTLTASTGVVSGTGNSTYGNSIKVSGLSLGLHKVRITQNVTTAALYPDCFDIITPIHSTRSNLVADFQNTLSVGSCALSDNRQTSIVKTTDRPRKNWAQASGVAVGPSTTSTFPVPMPDMSVTFNSTGGRAFVSYDFNWFITSLNWYITSQVYVDGVAVGTPKLVQAYGSGQVLIQGDQFFLNLSPGVHKIDVYWYVNNGTGTAYQNQRNLTVGEV